MRWDIGGKKLPFEEPNVVVGVRPEKDRIHIIGWECGMDEQVGPQAGDANTASHPALINVLDRAGSTQKREWCRLQILAPKRAVPAEDIPKVQPFRRGPA